MTLRVSIWLVATIFLLTGIAMAIKQYARRSLMQCVTFSLVTLSALFSRGRSRIMAPLNPWNNHMVDR